MSLPDSPSPPVSASPLASPPASSSSSSSAAAAAASTPWTPVCRICLSTEGGELVMPCACRGSVAFVHEECLEHWRLLNLTSSRATTCELCNTQYIATKGGWAAAVYKTSLPALVAGLLVPLALLTCEVLPRLPRRSKSVDVFGMDLRKWRAEAFSWALDDPVLQLVNARFLTSGGIVAAAAQSAAEASQPRADRLKSLRQIVAFALLRLGSLGVLARFLFSTRLVEPPRALVRIRSRGWAVVFHYLVSCVALQGVQTPRTSSRVPLFLGASVFGLAHLHSVMLDQVRRVVIRRAPWLEL